ncbi:2,4-dichlorophenol 6-monooxygenase [Cytospora mali]|uniref:2,4-dichlorophenol 6-monooxygenase n=1 Tax=Cytospora mali TaxID=578113 RepID=A0A194WCR0_CYTMA|nr:2,4-dichlorophenol 6-monooxygenase [Valsa mali]
MASEIQTDFLVVGTGPAGAGLACFLGQNGMEGIMITNTPSTADTPRAHLVNPFTLECLRDISVEDDSIRLSLPPEMIGAVRYSRSLLGEDLGNVLHWEGVPENAMNVKKYSPSRWVDLPQTYMEPILVNYASHNGVALRFSTQLVSAEKDPSTGEWVCLIEDHVRKDSYRIRTKYLFGADGGRSQVARLTKATFSSMPSKGIAANIIFTADLSDLMNGKNAQLHTIVRPTDNSRFGGGPVVRMVRPWNQWLLICAKPGATPDQDPFKGVSPDDAELEAWIRDIVGLDDNPSTKAIPVKVQRIDSWVIRETVADNFIPAENAFLLGDAAHRHPPAYGLGSNTCVQDGYNLAWKVAYVAKGLAGPKLLQSYDAERQPVGAQLVREANICLEKTFKVWDALGMTAKMEERVRSEAVLTQATAEGEERRRILHEALESKMEEGRSLGLCMNQWYVSDAVYLDDEPEPRKLPDGFDRLSDVFVSTYPGNRLPHAWLSSPMGKKPVSTHDLAGKGAFSLFTSYGGNAWRDAAREISERTGIPINTYDIGLGLEFHDINREWYERRGVEDSGCVLVRPDRFVAWRSSRVAENCKEKLSKVFDRILSRE